MLQVGVALASRGPIFKLQPLNYDQQILSIPSELEVITNKYLAPKEISNYDLPYITFKNSFKIFLGHNF